MTTDWHPVMTNNKKNKGMVYFIINKKRNISPEMAIKLSRYFRTSPEVWLNLQNQYDLYRIKENKKDTLESIKPYIELHKAVNY